MSTNFKKLSLAFFLTSSFLTQVSYASENNDEKEKLSSQQTITMRNIDEEDLNVPLLNFLKDKGCQESIKLICEYWNNDSIEQNILQHNRKVKFKYPLLKEDKFIQALTKVLINKQNLEKKDTLSVEIEEEECDGVELLFKNNLSNIGIQIIKNLNDQPIKKSWIILHDITEGKSVDISEKEPNKKFWLLAYKVANHSQNTEMVQKLYKLGAQQEQNNLKEKYPILFSKEANYIHEPFWSYNICELQEYGKRMIDKMKPFFILQNDIVKNEKGEIFVKTSNTMEKKVREVPFGYVFPNIFLKQRLNDLKDQNRAVPEIFILEKNDSSSVNFIFKMPSSSTGSVAKKFGESFSSDSGNNTLQVLCNDFIVYQEWIPGNGFVGDRSFSDLGHADYKATQIIKWDNKKYLIDTKEQKNFFTPMFFPFSEDFCRVHENLSFSTESNMKFDKRASQKIVMHSKNIHFDLRKRLIPIKVEFN